MEIVILSHESVNATHYPREYSPFLAFEADNSIIRLIELGWKSNTIFIQGNDYCVLFNSRLTNVSTNVLQIIQSI